MKKLQLLARASLLISIFALQLSAGERYLLRSHPSVVNDVCKRHGLKLEKQVKAEGLYVVSLPDDKSASTAVQQLKSDSLVQGVEKNSVVTLPELSSKMTAQKVPVTPRGASIIPMAGNPWSGYTNQPANTIVRIPAAQSLAGYGSGITVAVIDTGVDYNHPVLTPVIDRANGRNFLTGTSDASVAQETTPWVDQETTPWVDGSGTIVVNQETTPWVDQETTPWVDGSTKVPPAYGHGTMVAGIVHLVAPRARIMPLKAFSSDGSGTIADVIEAIGWAVDHGADVISMSFSAPGNSPELTNAIAEAAAANVICVASVSNDGKPIEVYPSNIQPVIGVGATTNDDYRASFSNYGNDVDVAAPGVQVASTYPQNRYAYGTGTSFSTPYVAGTVALMRSMNKNETAQTAVGNLDSGAPDVKSKEMDAPRLDAYEAVKHAK